MASTDDPYTQVHDKLWALLEASSTFTGLVASGNRIKYATNSSRSPLGSTGMSASYPKVRIIPEGGATRIAVSSCSTNITKRWLIQMMSGDQRPGEKIYPIEWAVARALFKVADETAGLLSLTWNDGTTDHGAFVKGVKVGIETGSKLDEGRGISGWDTVWACEVDMWFTTSHLDPS